MILYINVQSINLLEIKRLSQKYADRMDEHPNIFAINLMKEVNTSIKKKITSRLTYLIVL